MLSANLLECALPDESGGGFLCGQRHPLAVPQLEDIGESLDGHHPAILEQRVDAVLATSSSPAVIVNQRPS